MSLINEKTIKSNSRHAPTQQLGRIRISGSDYVMLNLCQDMGNAVSVAGFWMAALHSMAVDSVARVGNWNPLQQIPPTFHGCFW